MEGIYVIAEHLEGKLKPSTYSTIVFARSLAEATDEKIKILLLGHPVKPLADELAGESGVDVIGIDHPGLKIYNAEAYKSVLVPLIRERKPAFVILPHTSFGCDLGPRLALGGSSLSGVVEFRMDQGPLFTRTILGGKLNKEIRPLKDKISVITVMPGSQLSDIKPATRGNIEILSIDADTRGTRTIGIVPAPERSLNLGQAEVIVAAGRGIGAPESLDMIKELADCFEKGMLGASRPLVDYGWLPLEHQVGQTGQTVSPRVYIACGISGQIQHTVGMSGSECIIAVNTDPQAPIFSVASYGVTQDMQQLLPVLIEKLKQAKG